MAHVFALTLLLQLSITYAQSWRKTLKINVGVSNNYRADNQGDKFPADWYMGGEATYASLVEEESNLDSITLSLSDSNFRSLLLDDWKDGLLEVDRVKLSFGLNGVEQKFVMFDTSSGSVGYDSWLSKDLVESSSWSDLNWNSSAYVSAQGISQSTWVQGGEGWDAGEPLRYFVMWSTDNTCVDDNAWFALSRWENWNGGCGNTWGEGNAIPNLFWSPLDTHSNLNENIEFGETLVMMIELKLPTVSPTPAPTEVPSSNPSVTPTDVPSSTPTQADGSEVVTAHTMNTDVFRTEWPEKEEEDEVDFMIFLLLGMLVVCLCILVIFLIKKLEKMKRHRRAKVESNLERGASSSHSDQMNNGPVASMNCKLVQMAHGKDSKEVDAVEKEDEEMYATAPPNERTLRFAAIAPIGMAVRLPKQPMVSLIADGTDGESDEDSDHSQHTTLQGDTRISASAAFTSSTVQGCTTRKF